MFERELLHVIISFDSILRRTFLMFIGIIRLNKNQI